MVRLHRALLVCGLAVVAAACAVAGLKVDASSRWPTLLEATAIAGDKWAPEGRNHLERMAQVQSPAQPVYLGARNNQHLFFGEDARGHLKDTQGNQAENIGRAREPTANPAHFGGPSYVGAPHAYALSSRAPRSTCAGGPCQHENHGPIIPPPVVVPPPAPLPPVVPPPNSTEHKGFPVPPPPELPLPTPPKPSCGELCNPKATDPILARVPSPPLDDTALAAVGLEGEVLKKVLAKLRNREGWLRAQKNWLTKAVEAAATVRREIDLAESTKDLVAQDLALLKEAQDNLSLKYKASRLKWAFKDRKITLEKIKERFEALAQARADVSKQIREAKDDVTVLENTLGPPSEQVVMTPQELDEPLKFLEDVVADLSYNNYEA